MVKIKSIRQFGKFNFHVINGEWDGVVDPSSDIMIIKTPYRDEEHSFVNDFKNVLDLTKDEKDHWYVTRYYDTTLSAKKEKVPTSWNSDIPF